MDAETIPFRILEQSHTGFVPTNGRRHHPGMDYTRANIDHLRGRRSIKQVGEDSRVGQSWLQRYMNPDKKSGIQKANAVKLGQLAKFFGVSVDALTGRDLSATGAAEQSQPARLDTARLASLIELVEQAADEEDLVLPARLRARVIAAYYNTRSGEPPTVDSIRAALSAVAVSIEEL